MPCRCQNNMSFADANYLYQQKRCPCHRPAPLPEVLPLVEECACTKKLPINPCCACNGCSCVDHSCMEEIQIPCKPINCVSVSSEVAYRPCCDLNGTCCSYPCCCRQPFWPSFAHPRWLCCKDLYSAE